MFYVISIVCSGGFCRQESLGAQMNAPEEEESDDPMVCTGALYHDIINSETYLL